MLLALALAAAPVQVQVTINGIDGSRTCRIQNLKTEQEARAGEAVSWDRGQGADIKIFCRRATGNLVKILRAVRGTQTIDLKMGFAIVWTERDGDRFEGRLLFRREGGDEEVEGQSGAQMPLLPGRWRVQSFDDAKQGWREDQLMITQGTTLEHTADLAPGKVRVSIPGGTGQVDLIAPNGKSQGYGPTNSWIELPPNRYQIKVTRHDDLAQVNHDIGSIVVRPKGSVERKANPILGILRWNLKEPLGELKLYNEEGDKLLAEGLTGERWKVTPGTYRLSYQLPSNDILGLDVGAKAEKIVVRAGRATAFGQQPKYGEAVVRLRRGQAPQYGQVELLNPADGELVGRFAIGQMVKVSPGRWPLRVIASDGKVIAYDKPLVIRPRGKSSVDLQRRQSRLRVNLTKDGKRAPGTWQVLRSDQAQKEPLQAVSGEAMDLDPGAWLLRVQCASGRGGQERRITLKAGSDLEEELLCN